jgi:hypothetical protein
VETGEYPLASEMEDLFACTIVVENLQTVSKAETLINEKFALIRRKPADPHLDAVPPDSFKFDDLRLHVRWKDAPGTKPTGFEGKLFEVQIKTFLQHAWGIATHDLMYKSPVKDWAKERIAYQTKAILESAEVALREVEALSKSESLDKSDRRTAGVRNVLSILTELWTADRLPMNKKLLAETIYEVIHAMELPAERLRQVLLDETSAGRGLRLESLSPYGIVIQSLLNHETSGFARLISGPQAKVRILLYRELAIPPDFPTGEFSNVIRI